VVIRDLKFADIHAVTSFLLDCHTRTIYAKNGSANVDVAETKRLIGAGIGRHGHKGPGACWLQVAENEARITGLMYATLHRVYSIYDKLYATDLFWITNAYAHPGDALRLMKNMVEWASASPLVIEVQTGVTAIVNGDYVRTGGMLKRLGMQEYGAIHRLDLGECPCLDSSAESQKSSPPSPVALPN
jgi:hypothetical protein